MKLRDLIGLKLVPSIAFLLVAAYTQSPVVTISLGPNQIGLIKAAPGITTRISFPDVVREVICGDLYDPATGRGSFVVQGSGNDVFLRPIPPRGMSNLFVKAAKGAIYNFDLEIVSPQEAARIVYVKDMASESPAAGRAEITAIAELLAKAQQEAEEILRSAKQKAASIVAEAEQRASELERQASDKASQEVERRFSRALLLGLRERKIPKPSLTVRNLRVSLHPVILILDDRAYLRYAIQNLRDEEFSFGSISLEALRGAQRQTLPIQVTQNKDDNRLSPNETLTGVVTFDPKRMDGNEKVVFLVKGADDKEIARIDLK